MDTAFVNLFSASFGLCISFDFVLTILLTTPVDEPYIWNRSRALGKGRVDLRKAKRVFHFDLLFIVLKDNHKSIARIPKPFWAEDPEKTNRLLENIK